MESFGPTLTAAAIPHCKVPDRKPPDKTNENAGPVAAGSGAEKKSLAQRLQFTETTRNWLSGQGNRGEVAPFEGDTKTSRKTNNWQYFHTADTGSVREQVPYLDDAHWQSIGRVIDRLLVKGGAA